MTFLAKSRRYSGGQSADITSFFHNSSVCKYVNTVTVHVRFSNY